VSKSQILIIEIKQMQTLFFHCDSNTSNKQYAWLITRNLS